MNEENYLTPEELDALKQTFYVQTRELLADFGEKALELESAEDVSMLLRALGRTVHTIKGDSMALDFSDLARLAHHLEDNFRALGESPDIEREQVDLLLAAGDAMSSLLEAYCGTGEAPPDVDGMCETLSTLTPKPSHRDEQTLRREGHSVFEGGPADLEALEGQRYRLTAWFAKDCQMHSAGAFLVRQRMEKIASVASIVPDPETDAFEKASSFTLDVSSIANPGALRQAARVPGVISRVVLKKRTDSRSAGAGSEPSEGADTLDRPASGQTGPSEQLRVEVGKIDRIMNLVGELVIGRSMVAQAQSDLSSVETESDAIARLSDANTFLERALTDLQAAVLKIRMVPVERVFRRFPRIVRDLAHSKGKKIELQIRGGLTELDKSIVDALGEPLLHLVRNSIDHGLESPDEREQSGKTPVGKLVLQAFYEGNHVHVVVEDDGRGIDVAQVAEKAVRLGLIEPSQLDGMTASEILNTIYQPGFSTRDTVSDVSGRGIGMDVVRESIESLKGVIELTTAPGRGTRFLMRLPLTLAILRAVLVEVADRVFAVPLTGVLEIVGLRAREARTVLGRGVLHWRDQVVPLVPLRKALDLPGPIEGTHDRSFVLLVGEAERRIGLVAERLLGEQELVVKPIEDPLTRSPGIAGASILGNGRVVLILHVRGLLDKDVSLARRVEVLH